MASHKRLPVGQGDCASAAHGGHFEILKWAHANDCPWDAETCWRAAEGGHLEMLKWARANGCLWDANTWRLEMLK